MYNSAEGELSTTLTVWHFNDGVQGFILLQGFVRNNVYTSCFKLILVVDYFIVMIKKVWCSILKSGYIFAFW